MQSPYPYGVEGGPVKLPTNDWSLVCTDCEFRGAASSEALAEELADTHRSVTDHAVAVDATEESLVA
jgi:hypothetical protein